MDVSRNRRGLLAGLREDVKDNRSSDSDDVRIVEENQHPKAKNTKKTMRKIKNKEDELLERTLRESGIDCTGMSKEEKENIAQVIMMSKHEADGQNQMDNSEGNHCDFEDEKNTAEAFQQAVHPDKKADNRNDSHHVRHSIDSSDNEINQPVSFRPNSQTDLRNKEICNAEDEILRSNAQAAAALIKTVHPVCTPDSEDDPTIGESSPLSLEEDSMHATTSKTNVKPLHEKQRKIQNYYKKDGQNQTKMDQFSHVIIADDESGGEYKDIDTSEAVNLIKEDDCEMNSVGNKISSVRDDCEMNQIGNKPSSVGENTSLEEGTSDARYHFSPDQLKELMTDDDSSPVKRPSGYKKKAFVWSEDSDEETQDFYSEKRIEGDTDNQESRINNTPPTPKHDVQRCNTAVQEEVQDEPFSEEFYNFPQLHRHYRNVKKDNTDNSLPLFAPDESSTESYTKALVQLFTLYHVRLSQLQKLSKNYLKWPEPVKVGFHLDNTLDARKRGLNYDFFDVDDDEIQFSSRSVIPINTVSDQNNSKIPSKPAVKNFTFKARNEKIVHPPKIKVTPEEEIDDFLDTFVTKQPLRSGRVRNNMNLKKKKTAEDFEPFSVEETFKTSAQQGRKRKLYNEGDHKYGTIVEDESSNDFDVIIKSSMKSSRGMNLKNAEENICNVKTETQSKRIRPNGDKDIKMTRGSIKRFGSDLSTGSTESIKSEDLTNLLNPVRPPSRSSDASMDGLSQNSDVLIDPQGQIYSTQFCAMKEKRAKTPVSKSSFNLTSIEDPSVKYLPHNDKNQSTDVRVPSTVRNSTPDERCTMMTTEDKTRVSGVIQTSSDKTSKLESEPQTSIKSRIMHTIGNFIKLGPSNNKQNKKSQETYDDDDDKQYLKHGDRIGVENSTLQSDTLMETQEFQQTSDIMEEDIQVNKGEKTYSRKQRRKRHLTEEDDVGCSKVSKVVTVPCPLCNKEFPQDMIENHAADCNGPVEEENSEDPPNVESVVFTKTQKPKTVRKKKQQDKEEDFVIEEVESDEDVNEKLSCYICDKVCKNQQMYNQHVEKCLEEATQMQHRVETRGLDSVIEHEEGPVQRRSTRSARSVTPTPGYSNTRVNTSTPGYSSGSEEEKVTLREVINDHIQSSTEESSYSDEYDWSPVKTPPDYKPVNKENILPGGWTLEELTNSPIKSFIPIWKQSDNEGFKTQFDRAKQRFERQKMKGKQKKKSNTKQRRKRKRKSNTKQKGNKKQKCCE